MTQKNLKKIFKNSTHLFVVLMVLYITLIYTSPALAAGLAPPPATTEPYTGTDINQNPIVLWVQFFVNWLSVIIVVGSIIMIAIAGIQYSAAGGESGKIAEAKKKITNVITALLAYFFLYAFLQWLVPGGVF